MAITQGTVVHVNCSWLLAAAGTNLAVDYNPINTLDFVNM